MSDNWSPCDGDSVWVGIRKPVCVPVNQRSSKSILFMSYISYDKIEIDVHYSLIFYNYEVLLFPEQRELSVHNCVELYQVQ